MAIEQYIWTALSTILKVLGGIVGAAIIASAVWILMQQKRYAEFDCVILRLDGTIGSDKAGIFEDTSIKEKRFFMKHHKVGLTPDQVPYKLLDGKHGNLKAPKVVFLVQTGLKNFHFMNINIDKNKIVKYDVGEEDVNWALYVYEKGKKLGIIKNKLIEMIPYIVWALLIMGTLILVITILGKFEVMGQVADSLTQVGTNLEAAATRLSEASTGTRIIQ